MSQPEDRSTLRGRVGRYRRVGATMSGLAARLAGNRFLGLSLDHAAHAADMRAALGGLKGPLMKAAQMLATIPDALPGVYQNELGQLQANAPSMGWLFVKRRMETELGPHWQLCFRSFERKAARAASLGQVHRAESLEGRLLACKLQYPDMQSAVEADLEQLRVILAILQRTNGAIETSQIHAELSDRLHEELNYVREAQHTRLFSQILTKETSARVPQIVPTLSTKRLLTMEWLDGEPLISFADSHKKARTEIARNMFRAWYVPFYGYGVIHGDPHLGNYTVRPDDFSINLYDFGCIRIFPISFVGAVIDLYHALREGDEALAVHAYETWGFKNLTRDVIEVLNIWANFVYAPLMEDKVQRIQDSESGVYGASIAQKVQSELRRLGGVMPPREFVLMDRAAIGLGAVFLRIKAELNWYRMFHRLVDDFDIATATKRQADALAASELAT